MGRSRETIEREPVVVSDLTPDERQEIIDKFHTLYYQTNVMGLNGEKPPRGNLEWYGVPTTQNPLDMLVYQELIWRTRPALVVETGTRSGGLTLFIASILQYINKGRVVSVDVERSKWLRPNKRIVYMEGSSTAPSIVDPIRALADEVNGPVLVFLDSDHSKAHVLAEMRLYGPLVTTGSYMVVCDTNMNGRPISSGYGDGPHEAVEQFLEENDRFEREPHWEKFLMTWNPGGYLKKVPR